MSLTRAAQPRTAMRFVNTGDDDRLRGVITDRDIVVNCVADRGDPSSAKVAEMGEGKPVTIGADDSVNETSCTMTEHAVRRLPVIDGDRLVGVVSQADVAENLPEDKVGDLVAAISAGPPTADQQHSGVGIGGVKRTARFASSECSRCRTARSGSRLFVLVPVAPGTAEVPVRVSRGPRSRCEPRTQAKRVPAVHLIEVRLAQGDDA